ncbi:hypothetical protein BJF82_10430 [Kytococcus sp. CUA-901]|nr:hypothetical protein BJF82_10430 [Kytococcus sp. CUA-901]
MGKDNGATFAYGYSPEFAGGSGLTGTGRASYDHRRILSEQHRDIRLGFAGSILELQSRRHRARGFGSYSGDITILKITSPRPDNYRARRDPERNADILP